MSSNFWGNNFEILFQNKTSFFPSSHLSVAQNYNAIVRLLTYISIILIIFTKDTKYILLPLGAMLVTYILFKTYPNQTELFRPISYTSPLQEAQQPCEKECIKPTVDNPFMNFNYITDDYHRDPGCKAFLEETPETEGLKVEITDNFNTNLYRDVSDLYSKNNSQRQFFTMPWTSWPNDQTTLAKWLYNTGPTCKENGTKCAPYWNPSASYSMLDN